jgi:multicomponent Na+:H+ antiporter subunit D
VSQFGLFGVGLALATPLAVTGALVTLVGHAVAKGGLFVAVGHLARDYGATTVADLARLAGRAPLPAAVLAVLGSSLVGIPPTVGFVGKWYLALGAVEAGAWTVASVVVLSTLLSLAYVGRLVERLYLAAPGGSTTPAAATDGGSTAPRPAVAVVLAVAAVLVVALGLASTALADWFAPVVEGWL